ncbi:MAG: DsbA family protein [Candidatus Nanoarchaeia archaeon]
MNSKKSNDSPQRVRTPIRDVNKKKFQGDNITSNHKKSTPEYVAHNEPTDNSTSTTQRLLSFAIIILIFIAVIVGVFFIFNTFFEGVDTQNDDFTQQQNQSDQPINLLTQLAQNNNSVSSQNTILVIENENCEFCQVEDLNDDIIQVFENANSSTNYTLKRISVNSNTSESIFSHLQNQGINYQFTPLYVFSSQVEEVREFSQELFNSLFTNVPNSTNYILNPQNIGVRYLNSQFELPNSTIQIGNLNATPITIMNDYWCTRCQVVNGDASTIADSQEEGTIPQNYSAPISGLLLAIKSVESPEELSFHVNYVPSPTSQESEQVQRMNYCAHEQDLFVELHVLLIDTIQNSQEPILFNDSQISSLAQATGLDEELFMDCLNSQEADDFVNEMNGFLQEEQITSLPFITIGNYPLLEIIDSQILSLLLESENEVFNN